MRLPMLKEFLRRSSTLAVLAGLLISVCGGACSSKEVTVTEQDLQKQYEQLSPEEREQVQRSQEAITSTPTPTAAQGMSEQQQQEVNEALRMALPPPAPVAQ